MDKAVIFGAFEFVGFYLCKSLLDGGYEVVGIPFDTEDAPFTEEKRLEVGRNTNFIEKIPDGNLDLFEQRRENYIWIFSLYDLYAKSQSKDGVFEESVASMIEHTLTNSVRQEDQIVFLLPIQFGADHFETERHRPLRERVKKVTEDLTLVKESLFIYLPTVFGPFQPASYYFQKMIEGSESATEGEDDWEWRQDAIFIEDLIKPMTNLIAEQRNGSFTFESGSKGRWQDCMEYLNGTGEMEKNVFHFRKDIKTIVVEKQTSIEVALTAQKEQTERYKL